MQTPRRLLAAALLVVAATSCGAQPAANPLHLAAASTAQPVAFTDEEVRYLAAQAWLDAERRAFLDGVAAMRAAVPDQLRRIMWCEAGSYKSLPRWQTHYAAFTHGYDGASGGAQITGDTWETWASEIGVDLARWPRAYLAPDFVQDAVATHGYATRGTRPWDASASCWRH